MRGRSAGCRAGSARRGRDNRPGGGGRGRAGGSPVGAGDGARRDQARVVAFGRASRPVSAAPTRVPSVHRPVVAASLRGTATLRRWCAGSGVCETRPRRFSNARSTSASRTCPRKRSSPSSAVRVWCLGPRRSRRWARVSGRWRYQSAGWGSWSAPRKLRWSRRPMIVIDQGWVPILEVLSKSWERLDPDPKPTIGMIAVAEWFSRDPQTTEALFHRFRVCLLRLDAMSWHAGARWTAHSCLTETGSSSTDLRWAPCSRSRSSRRSAETRSERDERRTSSERESRPRRDG